MNSVLTIVAGLLFSLTTTFVQAQSSVPDDAQIAGIVVNANQVDIDNGKLAEKSGSMKDVKDFAMMMISSHTQINKQAADLVKKLKVTPADSNTSKTLKEGGEANIEKLKKLKGKEFDKAYIDNEVTYHQTVIDTVDKSLIPNAKNPELKTLLINARPTFVAHLAQAKKIQSAMK